MKKAAIALFLMASLPLGLMAKTSMIDIEDVLNRAAFVSEVVVCGYSDSILLYHKTGHSDTLEVEYPAQKKPHFLRGWGCDPHNDPLKPDTFFRGRWPQAQDTVLLVLDSAGQIEVMALRQGGFYRFWTPTSRAWVTFVFFVPKKNGYRVLPECETPENQNTERDTCFDGCLVDIDLVKIRG